MIVIIPCGKAKQAVACLAKDMYVGSYHKMCQRYALSLVSSDSVFILSAKYGLLALTDEIESYELQMGQRGCVSAAQVAVQAKDKQLLDEEVVALGGKRYVTICREVWPGCKTPLEGVGGLGLQMQWISSQLKQKA